jgi:hypothetical protein
MTFDHYSVGRWAFVAVLVVSMIGCVKDRPPNATTQPVTEVDPAKANPDYWLNQPATVHALSTEFQPLWDVAEDVAHEHHFTIDRRDYRFGLLTTHPVISKQFFELWRKDASGAGDVFENSLGTIRRSIRFEFAEENGRFKVSPKVLVERYSSIDPKYRAQEADEAISYWYSLGRDHRLERRLAALIQKRLAREESASAR